MQMPEKMGVYPDHLHKRALSVNLSHYSNQPFIY